MARKKPSSEERHHFRKIALLVVVAIFLVAILFFWTKIFLYTKILFSGGVLVKLDVDKQDIILNKGDEEKITFTSGVTTNFLCDTQCNAQFLDIGTGKVIQASNFSLQSGKPIKKEFMIKAEGIGERFDLYRFDLHCYNIDSGFCPSEEQQIDRSILVSVKHNLSENELSMRGMARLNLETSIANLNHINDDLEAIRLLLIENNNSIGEDASLTKIFLLDAAIKDVAKELNSSVKEIWLSQNYLRLGAKLSEVNVDMQRISVEVTDLNKTLMEKVTLYNKAIVNTSELYTNLSYLKNKKDFFSNETALDELNSLITTYNELVKVLEERGSIENKMLVFERDYPSLQEEATRLTEEITSSENQSETVIKNISMLKVRPIVLKRVNLNEIKIELGEPQGIYCIFGECEEWCTTNACQNDPDHFPILFIHGHDFSKESSADYSLEGFNEIQKELEDNGYLNSGTISVYQNPLSYTAALSPLAHPLSFRTSYYFDVFEDEESSTIIQTKSENIDSYAIRLREIIARVKEKTGKEKVTIVAHSMGGLVSRRYLQLFGENDVSLLVLITVPNHGISGTVAEYCDVFGESLECKDMREDSLFINKLTNGKTPAIPTYNIIGTGCTLDGKEGDGIVTKQSALLDFGVNIEMKGICNGLSEPFHTEVIKASKYPESYEVIKRILKGEDLSEFRIIDN